VAPPPVRIRSAQDLFEVLSTGSQGARVAVLRDIIAEPTRALALGPHEGEDFVDLLLRLIPPEQGAMRKALTICLFCYDDPRTADFMAETFATTRDVETVLHIGERLAHQGVEFFRPFLWQDKTAQALAAARACAYAELEPKDRLRVALLIDREHPAPPVDEEHLPCWVAELRGPHQVRTRQLAEAAGEAALLLWTADVDRLWLLRLTERIDAARARREVERLLPGGELAVVQAAVRLGVRLPESVLESADPEVRAAGVAAGLADGELQRYLASSEPEAVAAVQRCSSVDMLLGLLGDERWEVRAEAVRRLAAGEERPVARVRARVDSPLLEERVAAVTLLERWGDEEWLATHLEPPG